MKKILMTLIACLFALGLVGCGKNEISNMPENDIAKFKGAYENLNTSSPIQVNIDDSWRIIYKTSSEIAEILKNGTGIIYFGFPECPWCRNAIPILLQVAHDNNMDVYYLDVTGLRGSSDNSYNEIVKALDEYLLEDKDGNKTLYVPDVYTVKEGKIMGRNLSTVSSQTDASIKMTEEQVKELTDIYQGMIDKIK